MKHRSMIMLTAMLMVVGIVAILVASNSSAKVSNDEDTFIEAARSGDVNTVKLFLDEGMSANTIESKDKNNSTVLMVAAMQGQTDTVNLLISRGADVNAKTNNGRTALMWASWKGHTNMAKALINNGADVNAGDNWSSTAILFAMSQHHTNTVEALLLQKNFDINARNFQEYNPLTFAISLNDVDLVRRMLIEGADVNSKDALGGTPLMCSSHDLI